MSYEDSGKTTTPPRMADVAKLAGVSKMTVSRVLAGRDVSQRTQKLVHEAIETLGYLPDASAGTLATGRSEFIVALVPSLASSNFADTVRGLNDAVSGHGLCLLLGDTDYHLEQEALLVRTLLRHRPVGVMLTGSAHLDETRRLLRQAQVPVVETWDIPDDPIEQSVGFSNVAAAAALYEHLHRQGYRRIGYIGGASVLDHRGQQRQQGYLQAVAAAGAQPRVMEYGESPITMSHGGESVKRLLDKWPDTDAVMCVSDLSAFGAIMECHRQGRRVPGDIAIAGFGDFEVSRYCTPTITTVSVDPYRIGRRAGELLVASAAAQRLGLPRAQTCDVVEFQIMAREST
ncbi:MULTISPECIES: LacI family DNA-binding transcriptional regulator [Pseudomonas]|uniref:LacI family DNA-binding transcriptional regulator n=1 Tax=Pseudomonas azadiae TaxID=2843612 RepID=A0ABS6NTK9_9PSED|nr:MULTISPECIES: LacI family DNA-binding transcriptional regulator [Pseudomonas]MBV4451552.1 LacI family DNA-binding transcriptional regulator [Pseudomonas azadiae]NMF43319.1 LacI family DNA-binding transcriptional regulator [Pseudomonas sp. SWRI 103]